MRLLALPLFCAVLLAGCRTDPAATPAAPDPAITATPDAATEDGAAPSGNNFEIIAGDDMRFSLKDFSVTAGDTVTVTLRNAGALPKETFGHNFVLLKKNVDVESFLADAAGAKDADFIPTARAGDLVAYTRLLGSGETQAVTFTAPAEAGTYTYVCTFPGHGAMMRGTMTVTEAP